MPKKLGQRRLVKTFVVVLLALIAAEATLQVAYRIYFGYWRLANLNNPGVTLSEWHPYLVGALKPDTSYMKRHIPFFSKDTKEDIIYTNNSLGYRGKNVSLRKPEGVKRIVTLGGSSTYCLGVSDEDTWPSLLEKKLGPGWEVINLGVNGYSTVENLIQTALLFSDLAPDYAIYYEGWNDLRNAHIKDLKADYSDFHGPSQYFSFKLDAWKFGEWSALQFIVKMMARKICVENPQIKPVPADTALTDKIDERALSLYARNLKSIIMLCKSQNIVPIMVPQVLNYEDLTGASPNGFMPFVRDRDIKPFMAVYNDHMRQIASNQGVPFLKEILAAGFNRQDFWDQGHFNRAGDDKFAGIIANFLKNNQPRLSLN